MDTGWLTPELVAALSWVLPVLFAITLHEAAHGYVAEIFGDDTARRLGRISANPFRHVDRYGTIALPAILLAMHSPIMFGYAKPVPVRTDRLQPRRLGSLLVAFAGPLTNFLQAVLCALLLPLATQFDAPWVALNFEHGVMVNAMLAVFNMLPVLPLDGGRVLRALMPEPLGGWYAKTEAIGMVLVILIVFLPSLGMMDFVYDITRGLATSVFALSDTLTAP